MVAVSACMSGTRGSGVLSSTGDVLVRGVGGVCDMCMCLARGGVGGVVFFSLIALCYCSRATPFDYVNMNKQRTLYIRRHLP